MEPDALWERYLDPRFRAFAPTFVRRAENAPNQPIIRIGDLEIGEVQERPRVTALARTPRRSRGDRKSTRLNSSHVATSYDAFRLQHNNHIHTHPERQEDDY